MQLVQMQRPLYPALSYWLIYAFLPAATSCVISVMPNYRCVIAGEQDYQPNMKNTLARETRIFDSRKENMKANTTMHNAIVKITFLLLTMMMFGVFAVAQDHHDHMQEMKAPRTAQEHRERAAHYEKKAAEYRREVEMHKKMLTDYNKTVARNPKDTGENAYMKKMRLHCEKYSDAAETLAREAEEMAKFHTLRAKEIEGQ